MLLQILIHPKGIERSSVKPRQKHIDYDKQVDFAILHAERNILVIILKLFARRIVIGAEHFVIIADRAFQKVARSAVESGSIF